MYITLEFIEPIFGSGIYGAGFILGIETVSAKQRVLGGSIINSMFAFGEFSLGLIAYFVRDWRTLLRIIYIPTFFFASYYWIIPESVLWLLTKGKKDKAICVLKRVGKFNRKTLSESSIKSIHSYSEDNLEKPKDEDFMLILKNSTLLVRLGLCIFAWITSTLVYYGLSLNSVLIEGNRHMNFMLVCIIEIPAFIVNYFISKQVGRRYTLVAGFLLCGTTVMISGFISSETAWLKLVLFLIGKFSIAVSYLVTYIFTTELFPTSCRHRCMALCSMFGKFGSMTAPQTTLMVIDFDLFFIFTNLFILFRQQFFQAFQQFSWAEWLLYLQFLFYYYQKLLI